MGGRATRYQRYRRLSCHTPVTQHASLLLRVRFLLSRPCRVGPRWLNSCTLVCPRLLALPRHQLFRFSRDWAAGRVRAGSAAGETNERVACMFRGVGEILWEKVGLASLMRQRWLSSGVWERDGCFACIWAVCSPRSGVIHHRRLQDSPKTARSTFGNQQARSNFFVYF